MVGNRETALVLFIFLVLISVDVQTKSRSHSEEIGDFSNSTETLRFEVQASQGMDAARMDVEVRVKSGSANWTLTDPAGKVRLEGENSGGRATTETGALEPVDGTWTLEIHLADASGRYRWAWDAR
jgi:hypothetical protein